MQEPAVTLWHQLRPESAAEQLAVDFQQGLSGQEVQRRLAAFGPNRMTARRGTPAWVRFLQQSHQALVYILLAATIVSAALGEWVDASVIFGVVLVNAIVGFLQESKAEKAIEALARMVRTEATVRREGRRQRVASEDLVPGDVVLLQSGDSVPADLRLSEVRSLHIEEAALTGESVPVEKSAELLPEDTVLGDRRNLAFAGTLVTYGQAEGVVVATGERTEMGRIATLISEAVSLSTPLTRKIAAFSRLLLYVILGLAALSFLIGVLRGERAAEMFMAAVALAVGAIPEGLPAAVTITLAIGVSRMARRHAIIRKMPAVETLGSTTVICSDKTGTQTENQMTVSRLHAGGQFCEVTGAGLDPHDTAARHPRLDVIPFESERMYMATLHADGPDRVIYQKGSAERILASCDRALDAAGREVAFDHAEAHRAVEQMAAQGLRVLAFARRPVPASHQRLDPSDVDGQLTFLGLQGMIDPPRAEAVRAVAECQQAGIEVKMITGDHLGTAVAVARQLGLRGGRGSGGDPMALTGRQLTEVPDAQLPEIAERTAVFARVAPEQKLRLVRALRQRGHVVAMTGDGVNDAPALKQADIGIAMGITGTDVSKGAADMILADGNFASIEAAVEEGRNVFDNLTKFITWTMPTNGGEGLIILAAILLGTALPVLPVQLLWINIVAVGFSVFIVIELKKAFDGRRTRPAAPAPRPALNLPPTHS